MYLAQIGDRVWHDRNANGIQDSGETGIGNVVVKLLDKDGNSLKETKTNSSGAYLFEDLPPGEYIVEFVKPSEYDKFTLKDVGSDNSKDSDGDRTTGRTEIIKITQGQRDMTNDVGLYKLGSLGDRVWKDKNVNSIQDSGEEGIKGITVKLLDKNGESIKETTTGDNGNYKFTALEPMEYKIEFINSDDTYKFSPYKSGLDDTKDNDAVEVEGDLSKAITRTFTLYSGDNNMNFDAGLHKGLIGDYVWHDLNADGRQEPLEKGIPGVRVELLDKLGDPIKNLSGEDLISVTNANGIYEFNELNPGEYKVKFTLPNGYSFSVKNNIIAGSALDSDADITGITGIISLGRGEVSKVWDAGIYLKASLGDFVWLDKNEDGVQDDSEMGIEGVLVKLLDSSRNVLSTTRTDNGGKYSFMDLIPGSYIVEFSPGDFYRLTERNKGSDPAKDSNSDSEGRAAATLISGDNDTTIDSGYLMNSGISIEKSVYAGHDGGSGTGEELVVGEDGTPITYVFKVTNTGKTYLNNIKIEDESLGINNSQMINKTGDELLAPGQSLIYYYETTINGTLTNTAKVEGTPADSEGNAIPNGDVVKSSDDANVNKVFPNIEVQKTVYAGHDNGLGLGEELVVGEKGTPVTYLFAVKNTGDTYLKDILIKDEALNIDRSKMVYLSGVEPLAPGEVLVYYYETDIDGDLINTAEVEGTPCNAGGDIIPNTKNPKDDDVAAVDEVKPEINVEKKVYKGHDGGTGEGLDIIAAKKDVSITYLFTVKNIGDTYLKDIKIEDEALEIDRSKMTHLSGTEPLAPGEVLVYYYETKMDSDLKNTVKVEGTPSDINGVEVPNTKNPKVRYTNRNNKKMKLQVKKDKLSYTYDFNGNGNYEQFPLQMGDGQYSILLLENIQGNKYKLLEEWKINAKIESEKHMYSISNSIVNWSESELAVKKAKDLVKRLNSDEEKVKAIYNYILNNIKYDKSKLSSMEAGYIPGIDSTITAGKGACYDFAATFAGMLRSVDIPAKLLMGESKNIKGYHAWNEVLIKGKWVVIDTSYDSEAKEAKAKYAMVKQEKDYVKEKVY